MTDRKTRPQVHALAAVGGSMLDEVRDGAPAMLAAALQAEVAACPYFYLSPRRLARIRATPMSPAARSSVITTRTGPLRSQIAVR